MGTATGLFACVFKRARCWPAACTANTILLQVGCFGGAKVKKQTKRWKFSTQRYYQTFCNEPATIKGSARIDNSVCQK